MRFGCGTAPREVDRLGVPSGKQKRRRSTMAFMASPMKTKIDGRKARHARTQEVLVIACRTLMCSGDFRPSMASVCSQAGRSSRTGFDHFTTLEAVYGAALTDPAVGRAILVRACERDTGPLDWPAQHQAGIVHAIVFGRPMPARQMAKTA